MDVLLLRFDAPLMSFGGVVVDQHNKTDALPYRAMLTGLCANALGMTRRDEAALAALQARLRYAARRDRPGTALVDYQTVDFDPDGPMASDLGWTTRGTLEERKGGEASEGTHIRYRHYLADALVTVALTLDPAAEDPTLDALSRALLAPARPVLRGIEGARMKETYKRLADQYRIAWRGRRYDREHPEATDLANQAINHAVTAVESTAMVAVAVAGAIPQLGFIHEDPGRSFTLDVTDLFRDTVTLPVAFTAAKEAEKHPDQEIERITRRLAAKTLRHKRVVLTMIDRIKELLDGEEGAKTNPEQTAPCP